MSARKLESPTAGLIRARVTAPETPKALPVALRTYDVWSGELRCAAVNVTPVRSSPLAICTPDRAAVVVRVQPTSGTMQVSTLRETLVPPDPPLAPHETSAMPFTSR